MLFRPVGALSEAAAKKAAITFTVSEMLAYRDTWTDVEFIDVDARVEAARAPTEEERKKRQALKTSDSGFRPTRTDELTKADVLVRQMQGSLNKLTAENFDSLVEPLLQPSLFEEGVARRVVEKIFAKSLEEPMYANLYAKLCLNLARYEHEYLERGKAVRASILERAQFVFETQSAEVLGPDASDDARARLRKKKVANIKFIGCLFHLGLIADKVVVGIFTSIMFAQGCPAEVDLEVAISLMDAIGELLESKTKESVDKLFDRFKELEANTQKYCNRVRFAILNLSDLRKRKWVRPQAVTAEPEPVKAKEEDEPKSRGSPADGASAPRTFNAIEQRTPLPPSAPTEIHDKCWQRMIDADENDFTDRLKSISAVLADQTAPINRTFACYAFLTKTCLSARPEDHTRTANVMAMAWDPNEVRAALSWVITDSVVCSTVEDCPKFFERFGVLCVSTAKDRSSYRKIVREVFGAACSQLDSVYDSECGSEEWSINTLNAWMEFIKASRTVAETKTGVVPAVAEIFDAISGIKFGKIFGDILADMITALAEVGHCSYDDISAWKVQHQSSRKLSHIVEALEALAF